MKEKVYLSDWLYNAGIVGFLRIMTDDDIENQNIITIGENYVEFDRSVLQGFSQKYFDTAFKQYGRYDRVLSQLQEFSDDLNKLNDVNEISYLEKKYRINKKDTMPELPLVLFDRFKKVLSGFTFLKNSIKLPSKEEVKKDPCKEVKDVLEFAVGIMKSEYQEIFESDVQIYLRGIYGQKSFLNLTINNDRFKKFYEDFEKPILENKIDHEKELLCVNCGRKAKKHITFDTGISPFFGLNKDAINFAWEFNVERPLCEICELIYFCSFAALTPSVKNNDKTFFFVNRDSSITDLYKANKLLNKVQTKDKDVNFIVDFFTELLLESQKEKAEFALENIAVIELNLNDDNFPKVYSFNVSREKAKFVKDSADNLRVLARTSYKIKDKQNYILTETIDKVLGNSLDYTYLHQLEHISLSEEGKSRLYEKFFNSYHLQILNILIFNFLKYVINERRHNMNLEEKEIWQMYYRGEELSNTMKTRRAENKIPSIAYKLLNALKAGDVNDFMDIVMRTFMAYSMEVPAGMVKMLSDKEYFYPIGYGFLNGFLGKKKEEKENE